MRNNTSVTAKAMPSAVIPSTHKHYTWPTASKPAFYAAFYAVDSATWSSSR
ncbi:MAG: hypothetical protein NTZ06_04415 [Actinobacteria bacterium]|nr:hypothetical protein [Actinomycetota bacterium]